MKPNKPCVCTYHVLLLSAGVTSIDGTKLTPESLIETTPYAAVPGRPGDSQSWPGPPSICSPSQAVFFLKFGEMVTLPVIYRTDSRPSFSAHLCPTPLCLKVQKPKPPPWPQEGFSGEVPYREPLQPDTPARMELTGKKALKEQGPD